MSTSSRSSCWNSPRSIEDTHSDCRDLSSRRFGPIEMEGVLGHFLDDAAFYFAYNVHLAGFTVEKQGQAFLAVDELHGFSPHCALDASHAF